MDSTQADLVPQPITAIPKMDSESTQLDPVSPPIALFDDFVAGKTEVLTIEKIDYPLTAEVTLNDDLIFRVRTPSVGRIGSSRVVSDSSGKELFNLFIPRLFHGTYAAKSLDGKKTLVEVKGGSILSRTKATVTFTSTTGTKHILKVNSKSSDTNADIIESSTGAVVARVDRELLKRGDGEVRVAPGVDKLLIGVLCICFYELNNWY